MIIRYAIAAALAFAAMAAWSAYFVQTGTNMERARVEKAGKKINARAKAARRAVATKPAKAIRDDLRRYCVDC